MENWTDVVSFQGFYQVSDHGRVRSMRRVITRKNGRKHTVQSRVLKPGRTKAGYPIVALFQQGKQTMAYIHHLVLEAFVSPRPPDLECRHLNGVEADCRLGNLKWGTRSSNQRDRVPHGTSNRGKRNGSARLTPVAVREIRRLKASGTTVTDICSRYKMARRTIYDLLEGRTWGYVS